MDAAGQLDEFIDKYTPEIAAFARHMLGRMREVTPFQHSGIRSLEFT